MARTPNFPPNVKLHKATGQSRVRYCGRDYYLGPHGSEEAKAAYRQLLEDIEKAGRKAPPNPTVTVARPLTVSHVVAAWWPHAEATCSERGRELGAFRLSLEPLVRIHGGIPASDLNAARLEEVQLAMASGSWMTEEEKAEAIRRGNPVGWCRNVVNRRVVRIRTVWRWAERRGMVPGGAFAHLCTLPGLRKGQKGVRTTPKVEPTKWEDVRRVVRLGRSRRGGGRRAAAMILLGWWSGMRSCEIRLMRPCDVDRTGAVWVYVPGQHKGDWREEETPRVVALGPKCQAILRLWLARCKASDHYVFAPGKPTRPYSDTGYAQIVRRVSEAAGLTGFTGYRNRHAAKQRVTRAQGMDAARAVLGHISVGTTAGYAAGVDVQTAIEVARRLG